MTHNIILCCHHNRYSLNVWAGIINDRIIALFFLTSTLNEQRYWLFLRENLPELLDDVPLAMKNRLWFMHDGAPSHFSLVRKDFLDITYPGR